MYVRFKKFRIAKSSTKKLIYDSALIFKQSQTHLSKNQFLIKLIRRKNIFALNGAIYKPEIILSKLPLLLRDDPRHRKSQKENLRLF